jgi:hypothetical protein
MGVGSRLAAAGHNQPVPTSIKQSSEGPLGSETRRRAINTTRPERSFDHH